MKFLNKLIIFVISVFLLAHVNAETFNSQKVWLVDFNATANNFLFRGN